MNKIEFLGSFETVEQCPAMELPEYAFIGRSNVGKSSLINYLTEKSDLARISKKPGKTQTINLYRVDDQWVFTDLPGYGYAHVSKSKRQKWDKELWNYLALRPNLMCAMVLIDGSIPPQDKDLDFLEELAVHSVPWVLIFTKVDKIRSSHRKKQLQSIRDAILEKWTALPAEFVTSTTKRIGREELLKFILETNESFRYSLE